MPFLSVVHLTGDVDRYELTKRSPLSIGSHSSNNIALDEAGVEIMHCRVAWAKSGYEAVAAGMQGLDVNGSVVQRAMLKDGDILRFGTVDVRFDEGDGAPAPAAGKSARGNDDLPLLFEEEDEPVRKKPQAAPPSPPAPTKGAGRSAAPAPAESPPRKPSPPARPPAPSQDEEDEPEDNFALRDDALLKGFDALVAESQSSMPVRQDDDEISETDSYDRPAAPARRRDRSERPRSRPAEEPRSKPARSAPKEEQFDDVEVLEDEPSLPPPPPPPAPPRAEPAPVPPKATKAETAKREPEKKGESSRPKAEVSDRLRKALRSQDRHPSDRDPLQSPLVYGLAGITIVLALVGAVFYFMAGRQTTQAAYVVAEQLYQDKKFNTAIVALEKFAADYPEDKSAEQARILAGLAKVDQEIESATPDYPQGVEQLRSFISTRRERPGFEDQHSAITDRAGRISSGSAELAGKIFDRAMLDVSKEARGMLLTYSPKESPPDELLKQIDIRTRTSEAQILRHETFVELTKEIDSALSGKSPMKALSLRRDLLARYPDFANDRKVTGLMASTMAAEKSVIRAEELQLAAQTAEPPAELPAPASGAFSARSRSDQVSINESIYVLAKDCLYGIDTVTGAPVWRRVVGTDLPFFPILERGTPSLILFDTSRQELVRVHQHTGKLLWRQPFAEPIRGRPLLDEKQLYVPTEGGHLYKMELDSGSVVGKLTFSQEVTGPAALRDGQHLVVVGHHEVVYTLSKNPLDCVAVSYLGHGAGSVQAPLLTMGNYVLAIENRGDNATLRVLSPDTNGLGMVDTAKTAGEIAQRTVAGRVLDIPVIRGRDLFVPSSGERVSAFAISDDAGEPPVTTGPVFQTKSQRKSAVFLSTGPERQVWMAGSALRKLQLTPKALTADEKQIASGLASQPNQQLGSTLYNARRRAWTDAVTLTQTDRDEMVSDWQAVIGAKLLAWTLATGDAPGVIAISEAGNTFRATLPQLGSSGYTIPAIARLTLSEELTQPLFATALPDGQLAVVSGDPEPKLFIVNRLGQVDRQVPISQSPQLSPVVMGKRIVLPVAGKLQVLRTGTEEAIQDFSLPAGNDAAPVWRDVKAISGASLAALTETGQLALVRHEKTPRAHLAEITRTDLGAPPTGRMGIGDDLVAVPSADHKLSVFSGTLEPAGTRTFDGALTNDVWISGKTVFVDEAGQTLHCIRPGAALDSFLALPLEGSPVAGSPLLRGDELIVAQQNGTIRFVDLKTRETVKTLRTPSVLASGPFVLGTDLYVATYDGSFQKIAAAGGTP